VPIARYTLYQLHGEFGPAFDLAAQAFEDTQYRASPSSILSTTTVSRNTDFGLSAQHCTVAAYQAMWLLTHCSRLLAGIAPEMRAISLPDWKMAIVGMLRMPYCAPKACSSSVFTLMKRAREFILALNWANAGAIALQGPHHGAQKSTTTGTSLFESCAENAAWLTDIGAVPNKGRWHFPQLISFPFLSAGMRLTALHEAHTA